MNRIEYIQIGEKYYPMCFSVGARKKINEIYGSTNQFIEAWGGKDFVEAYLNGLEIMIKYGAARLNEFNDEPINEKSAVDDTGKWQPISREKLEIMLCPGDQPMIWTKMLAAINKAAEKEIEVAPTAETAKNFETASEATA